MSTLAIVALSVVALALALTLLCFLTTWRLRLGVIKEDTWQVSAILRAFDGRGPAIPISSKGRPQKPKASKKRRSRSGKWNLRGGRDMFGHMMNVLRCIHIRSARITARFGLGDPAETGYVYGLLASARYSVPAPVEVDVEPVFDHACLRGTASIDLSLRPIAIVPPALRLFWHLSRGAT